MSSLLVIEKTMRISRLIRFFQQYNNGPDQTRSKKPPLAHVQATEGEINASRGERKFSQSSQAPTPRPSTRAPARRRDPASVWTRHV